ncbi:MAG: hypothetical protein HS115_19005 [Spirochaetales bacterium]|nr:hypothetical protein [Spirochaetales bacterium]
MRRFSGLLLLSLLAGSFACSQQKKPSDLPEGYIFVDRYGRASRSALDSTDRRRIKESCEESARQNALKINADALIFRCDSEDEFKSCQCRVAVQEKT